MGLTFLILNLLIWSRGHLYAGARGAGCVQQPLRDGAVPSPPADFT